MPTRDAMKAGQKEGILIWHLSWKPGSDEAAFARADLVFQGVDHSDMSYEVRVFLNKPGADETTPRTPENGYAGRFVIFGHGQCYGDLGHCDIPSGPRAEHDLRPRHPLTPQKKIVTITDALRRIAEESPAGLQSVTLVPVSMNPLRKDRKRDPHLFHFDSIALQMYR